jgi:hypothetical protein
MALFIRRRKSKRSVAALSKSLSIHGLVVQRLLAGGELTVLQHTALATKVQNQQKAKYWNHNVVQKNGVLTAEEAWLKKEANEAK